MSISSLAISGAAVLPRPSRLDAGRLSSKPQGLVVECSSRPQKKGTKHHMKTRPKKTQPWDIRRKPTAYPPLPALPPDWTLLQSSPEAEDVTAEPVVAVQGDWENED